MSEIWLWRATQKRYGHEDSYKDFLMYMFELKSCRIIGPQSSVLVHEDFVWIKTDTFLWRHDFVKIYYFWIVPSQISQNLFLEFFSKKICKRYELKPLKKCTKIWTLSRSSAWGKKNKTSQIEHLSFCQIVSSDTKSKTQTEWNVQKKYLTKWFKQWLSLKSPLLDVFGDKSVLSKTNVCQRFSDNNVKTLFLSRLLLWRK